MRHLATFALSLLTVLPIGTRADSGPPRFPGALIIASSDRILLDQPSRGRARAVDEVWPWASVSKQVTAVMVMQKVAAGTWTLDDTIAARLPDFRGPTASRVTIEELLRHTSGLPDSDGQIVDGRMPAFYARPPAPPGRLAEVCQGVGAQPPPAPFRYNNCDTLVVQAMLERQDGTPFRTALAAWARRYKLSSLRLAGNESPAVLGTPKARLDAFGAAGAMIGTLGDIVRFDQALMRDVMLPRAQRDLLWRGEPSQGYVALGAWAFRAPLAGCDAPVMLVERRGAIGHVQIRNVIAPDSDRIVVMAIADGDYDFGEIWQGKGTSYDVVSNAVCGARSAG